ncbi:MAG: DUF2938 family protein [Gemmatimonadota bacterium]|jgi:hypothetical protein
MDLVVTGLVAGVTGTLVMDALNLLFARTGAIARIDVATIGRMAMGWARGRFRYGDPSEMEPTTHDRRSGFIAHYGIGVSLALAYVIGWRLLVGGPVSPGWAVVYGVATTVASWFLVFPSLGQGMLGRRSPEGLRAPLSSLANHLFYGVGLAVGIAVL